MEETKAEEQEVHREIIEENINLINNAIANPSRSNNSNSSAASSPAGHSKN